MAFARVKQTHLFRSVYNLPSSQKGSRPCWEQCWFRISYGRFGTARCSHIKRSSTAKGHSPDRIKHANTGRKFPFCSGPLRW